MVLGDSAFDHCEFLGSVVVAVENCQDAWCEVGIIKADRLSVCLPWCSLSPCSHDICGFKLIRIALQAGGGHLGRGCVSFEHFLSGQGREPCQL